MDNQLRDAIVREDAATVRRLCEEHDYPRATLNLALQLTTDGAVRDELFSAGADDFMGVIRHLIDSGQQNSVWNYFLFDTTDQTKSNLNPHQVLVWLEGHPLHYPNRIERRYNAEIDVLVVHGMVPELRRYLPVPVAGQPDMYRDVVQHAIGHAIEHSNDPRVLEYLLTLSASELEQFERLARNDAALTIAPVLFKYAVDHHIDVFGETELVERLLEAHRQDVFVLFYQAFEPSLDMEENGLLLDRAFQTNNHRIIALLLTKRIDVGRLIRALGYTFDPEHQRYHKKVVGELMEEMRELDLEYEAILGLRTTFYGEIRVYTLQRPTHQVEQLMAIFRQWTQVIEAQKGNVDPWWDIYELNYEQRERLYEDAMEAHRVESVIYWIKQGGFTRDIDHTFTHYFKDLQDQMEILQAIPDQSLREDELLDAPLLREYIERHQATRLRAYGTLPSDLKRFIDGFV